MTTQPVLKRIKLRLLFSILLSTAVVLVGWSQRAVIGHNWLLLLLLGAALIAKPFIPQPGLRRLCDLALTLVIL